MAADKQNAKPRTNAATKAVTAAPTRPVSGRITRGLFSQTILTTRKRC
jgi:hypothetical protein